ncbi:MAG: gamma-glutamyltransferase family protein [Pseudomonadota bacterium]
MEFTTRPDLLGTFGMVASTHYLASAVGMKLLEAGGRAADAAVGMGFVLNVVEPHLNGPLGEVPALVLSAGQDAPEVLCGQGTAPAGATIAHYRGEGLEIVPGSGLLATVIPGAFDAWMVMLRDHGQLSLRAVLEPAIHYASAGHPILARVCAEIAELAPVFETEWPTSAPVWLPGGSAPRPGSLFRNESLGAMLARILREAETKSGREDQIEAARDAFYRGFVAEAIDTYLRDACVIDATGQRHKGVLTADDMAGWQARFEPPLSVDHRGWQVYKPGFWSQGPAQLQALRILEHDTLDAPLDESAVHLTVEALKRAFADRDTYYGDPDFFDVPAARLLSREHAGAHRQAIGASASLALTPGVIEGHEALADAFLANVAARDVAPPGIGAGEPTMAHLTDAKRDTVHLDVIDRWGNAVSATPSGGWLKSSPVVPGLGVPLNSRAQMFWLDEGLPTSLGPGRRPRTTLSPSLARGPEGEILCYGTPGGDQQDQWQLALFLRRVHGQMSLQQAIDAPLFFTGHLQSSFYPRGINLGHLMVEPNLGADAIHALRRRGHRVDVAQPWSIGRLTAVERGADTVLRGAATPRLMQAYAIGR